MLVHMATRSGCMCQAAYHEYAPPCNRKVILCLLARPERATRIPRVSHLDSTCTISPMGVSSGITTPLYGRCPPRVRAVAGNLSKRYSEAGPCLDFLGRHDRSCSGPGGIAASRRR
ncbi:hypothetical protein L1887_59524 [Cichorium endivia]|nr:hypothetical protein L1887_59524 [Cichorium endivia]